jgi:hypothetical protein
MPESVAKALEVTVTEVAYDPTLKAQIKKSAIKSLILISPESIAKKKGGEGRVQARAHRLASFSYATVTVIPAGALNEVRAVSIWKVIV